MTPFKIKAFQLVGDFNTAFMRDYDSGIYDVMERQGQFYKVERYNTGRTYFYPFTMPADRAGTSFAGTIQKFRVIDARYSAGDIDAVECPTYYLAKHGVQRFNILLVICYTQEAYDNYTVPAIYGSYTDISDSVNEVVSEWIISNMSYKPSVILMDGDYIGQAVSNATTDQPVWQIIKATSGVVSYPNGDRNFSFVWDNRASYTYPDGTV